MAQQHLTYRDNAARARADADSATLANVRDRCLRAEAAWLDMAVRHERVETARGERERGGSTAIGGAK
jgi:hypothetical protein